MIALLLACRSPDPTVTGPRTTDTGTPSPPPGHSAPTGTVDGPKILGHAACRFG